MDKKKTRGIASIAALALLVGQPVNALALTAAPTQAYAANQETGFSDVQPGTWYYDTVIQLVNMGIISGYADGTFHPDGTITRAEFAKMAITAAVGKNNIQLVNGQIVIGNPFDSSKPWPENVIAVADQYDINWYGQDVAEWKKPINRAEMAKVVVDTLYEIADLVVATKQNVANVFKDKNEVRKSGCADEVYQAISVGLLNGNGVDANGYTEFRPLNNSKRSEAASVIRNMLIYLRQIKGELTSIAIPEKPAVRTEYPDVMTTVDGGFYHFENGVVNPDVARAKDIEALQAIRCGKDADGCFVVFTAPDLSQALKDAGFVFWFYADPQTASKVSLSATYRAWAALRPGESKKVYLKIDTVWGYSFEKDFRCLEYSVDIRKVFGDLTNFDDVTCMQSSDTVSISHSISSDSKIAEEEEERLPKGWTTEIDGFNLEKRLTINTEPIFEGLKEYLKK